jgi:RNA polymerase sigma-70 factor, ECF subfamily
MTRDPERSARSFPDQELLSELLRSGNPDDFSELVERFKKPIMKLAYRMTGDYEGSLEVAQETFIRAWRSKNTYDRRRPFPPWLFKIAANLSRDLMAKRRTRKEESLDTQEIPGEQAGAGNWQDGVIANISVQQLLTKLEEPYRTALILRFMQDLSYDDIAHIMETTPEQVKNYLFRGRRKMAELAKEVLT